MPKFIVTITDRYEVTADSAEQAIASYRVSFEDFEPDYFEMSPDDIIPETEFEYLDGQSEVTEIA